MDSISNNNNSQNKRARARNVCPLYLLYKEARFLWLSVQVSTRQGDDVKKDLVCVATFVKKWFRKTVARLVLSA